MDSTGPPKIPNGEDLNMISDFMNSVLHNMPQYYHNIPLNNGLTSDSDNRHLMNISNKVESMLNIKKTIKPGISIKPLNFNKKSIVNINPQNQYRKSSTLMQNLAKKLTQVKSSYNPNKNLKSSKDTLSNQKASPRKMQVVYKENDKYVSRSLSTMLKNTNQTIPLPDTKTRSRKLISAQSKKNFNISHTSTNIQKSPRRISSRSVAKPINIALPLQVVKDTSNSSKNKLLRVDGKVKDLMEKKIHRSKCNMRPISQVTDFTQSGRRSASLNSRNMRNGPSTSNQSKSSSRKIRRGLVANTPKKQEQVKNNKPSHVKSSLETNKLSNKSSSQQPKPILKNPQTENLVQNRIENIIKDQVQNQFKNVIQDKVEKTPLNLEPSANATAKSAPNQSINQDQPKKQVQDQPQTVIQVPNLTQNQNEVPNKSQSQTPAEDKTENRCQSRSSTKSEPKPIKFMKNTDNNNRYQFFAPSSITEQNSIRLINEKLEHLIDKIKEEKEVIRTNLIKQSNADLNENLVTQNKFFLNNNNKNVSNHNNRKQVPVVDSNKIDDYKTTDNNNNRSNNENTNNRSNNENNNNRSNNENNNKKIAHKHNTNRNNKLKSTSSTMSRINKNLPKLPPSVVPIVSSKFGTKLSRQSINNSSVVIKHSNQSHSTLLPRRDRNTMTPMEVVQDFINLVNKAKRDRKTYTVCGNFQSVRKAFTDRGWIEKMRINLIDDPVFKKLENLSNFELVEGIKDRDQGDKYRRIFISKLLSGHQVDFYWDYMQNPFSINNDKIKRTLINRFPFGATKVYTSKAGLCETLKEAYWYYIEGHANIYFPRTYNLTNEEDIAFFTDDFRRTAIISLLQWITKNSDKPRNIISPNGLIQTSIFNFATLQCFNFLKIKEHKDIDEIIPLPREYEWDIFLEKYYKIVHQGQHFKETDQMNAPLIIEQSKYILNKIRKFVPHVDVDGVMNLWLLKPNNGSRGTGIHVCRTLKYTLDTVQSRKETKYVVQKYLERPLLIQNTKFDIRQWFLVTCMPSLQVWLYKDCYLRFSSQHYDLSRLHESIHLTNNSVQCRYKNQNNRSNILPDSNMWHSDTFRKYLNDTGHPSAWKDIIYKGIKECLVGLFMLCQDKIITRVNSFELCGADFMISEDFRPYLIEINSRPALYASTRITAQLCPKVLEDVVKVTIDYARNPKASTGNFELVYKDTFNYIPPKNINSIYIEGISHVKFMNASLPRTPVSDDICDTAFIVKEPSPGPSIEKNLHIDPNKVRKDVKNTLEKILAIIHTEKTTEDKKDNNEDFETPEERNKQFKMMLSEFVDIITSVKVKET